MQAVGHQGTLLAAGAGEVVPKAPAGFLDLAAKLVGAVPPTVGPLVGGAAAGGQKSRQNRGSKRQSGHTAPHSIDCKKGAQVFRLLCVLSSGGAFRPGF
jgi:hypothetical protein